MAEEALCIKEVLFNLLWLFHNVSQIRSFLPKTTKAQAALFEFIGSENPLNKDSEAAIPEEFEVPKFLQGTWAYGIVARAIFQKYGNGDPSSIK